MIRPGRKERGSGQASFRAIMRASLGLMLLIALTYIPADMSRVRAETVQLPEDPSAYTQKKKQLYTRIRILHAPALLPVARIGK